LKQIPVSCNKDCGAGCPLLAHIENGKLINIEDNPLGGSYMRGCVKGYQMPNVVYSPDRIRKPLLRDGPRGSGEFIEISWSDALDRVAAGLTEIKEKFGCEAIIQLGGSGSIRGALHNTKSLTARFLNMFGGYTLTTGGYSAAAVNFVNPYLFGNTPAGLDPGTLQFSKLIVLWGANIVDTRFGCEMENRIREQKERGVPVIVIDPRRSRTVKQLGTEWISVYPGTDSALMAAVLYVWIKENYIDPAFIKKYSTGFEQLEQYIMGQLDNQPKTPEWAEMICGTPAASTLDFARLYGKSKPATLIPGLSIQRTYGGEEAIRFAVALQVAAGNVGILGGSSGSYTKRLPSPRCGAIDNANPPNQVSIPVYRWADAILEGRNGGYPTDIKAIYNVGGNYLNQGSDIQKNIKAFQKVEFSVCHDFFLTPTARYCDIVLPSTMYLEREDIVFPGSNYLFYSRKVIEPLYEAKDDYDIFCALAKRLGFLEKFSENKSAEEWLEEFIRTSEIQNPEEFKRTGIYQGSDQMRVGLTEFIADPERHPLTTPSGCIELASATYAETGFPAIPTCRILSTNEKYPLRLVTPHSRYRINSQNSNIPWFREREEQQLWMNSQDAEKRQIRDGQEILIFNEIGRIHLTAYVNENIMPGVVCLLQGIWNSFDADQIDSAGATNALTSTVPTEPSQGSRTHSTLVEVKPL